MKRALITIALLAIIASGHGQPGRAVPGRAPIYVEVCSLTIRHESRKSRGPTTLLESERRTGK